MLNMVLQAYSHDTSFVQIACGSALVCGFGYALGIRHMAPASDIGLCLEMC